MAHIVKFRDGTRGIRRWGWTAWEYKDLKNNNLWWRRGSSWFKDCKSVDHDWVRQLFIDLYDKGTKQYD